jgi:hypothetical protein
MRSSFALVMALVLGALTAAVANPLQSRELTALESASLPGGASPLNLESPMLMGVPCRMRVLLLSLPVCWRPDDELKHWNGPLYRCMG